MHVAQNGQDTHLALPVEYKHSDEASLFSYKPLACKKVPPPSLPLSVCAWSSAQTVYVTHSFIKMIMRHEATQAEYEKWMTIRE